MIETASPGFFFDATAVSLRIFDLAVKLYPLPFGSRRSSGSSTTRGDIPGPSPPGRLASHSLASTVILGSLPDLGQSSSVTSGPVGLGSLNPPLNCLMAQSQNSGDGKERGISAATRQYTG